MSIVAGLAVLASVVSRAEVVANLDVRAQLGGPATVEADGPNAFSLRAPGLTRDEARAFSVGNSFFRDNWVVAPASATGRDGLGPLFNANSCSACHPEDGRGHPPRPAGHAVQPEVGVGMVIFVSPYDADGTPHPVYGSQLQDQATPGVNPEVRIELTPQFTNGAYHDGTTYQLRSWKIAFADLAYGPLDDVRVSMRIGPQVIGGGLLEAIDETTLRALADPDDKNGDGISGRVHLVPDADGSTRIGRFGWKASQPTLESQVVAALHGDIGITSDARRTDNLTPAERVKITAPSGGDPEADAHKIERLAHYCRVLAVPMQRGAGTMEVERGRSIFAQLRCTACHVPELQTGRHSPIVAFHAAIIRPYTDLLLHDMGDGLADNRCDGNATGREWRTQPLWGIGLIATVSEQASFLHDGRARTIEEAVLWHGGEAQPARDAFVALPAADRAALLAFLQSL